MGKYIKKPVEVEAIQFISDFSSFNKVKELAGDKVKINFMGTSGPASLLVETLEGEMLISCGDYVIKGVEGEIYPCKESIFKKTYERVGE